MGQRFSKNELYNNQLLQIIVVENDDNTFDIIGSISLKTPCSSRTDVKFDDIENIVNAVLSELKQKIDKDVNVKLSNLGFKELPSQINS